MRFSDILERLHRLLNNSTYVCDTRQRYSLYLSRIYSSLLENPFYHLLRKTKLYEKKEKLNASMLYLILDRKSRLKKKTIIFKKLFITHVHLFIYQDRVTCKNLKHDSLPPPLVHVSIARDTMSGTGVQSVRKNDIQISKLL